LLEWVRDFCRPLAHQSGVIVTVQNGLPGLTFPADRHRLEQVLLNLVLNGLRATPTGGWIELSGRQTQDGTAIVLAVADTGTGISPDLLRRLFEPGFTTRAGGPGLGLAVCRKIVEQHGGTITAQNRPECGSIFTLTFPTTGSLARKEVHP
jgi:signal transduction histidine kinase